MTRSRLRKAALVLGVSAPLSIGAGAALAATGTLKAFLLRSGEQTGFAVHGKDTTWTTPQSFVKGEPANEAKADIRALKAGGFNEAIDEGLAGARGAQGFSMVVLMGSSGGARELAQRLGSRAQSAGNGKGVPIRIPGAPNATGYSFSAKPAVANVYWAVGDCALGSGDYFNSSTDSAKPVIAGVEKLMRRVGRACP